MNSRLPLFGVVLAALLACGACSRSPNNAASPGDGIPVYPLSNRFSSFSTGPDLILVKIANSSSNTATIVIENPRWFHFPAKELNTIVTEERYVNYMLTNHTRVFTVNDQAYTSLVAECEAELLPEHLPYRGGDRQSILDTFMQKEPITSNSFCYTADFDGARSKEERSLARLFIEEGIQVYRGCVDGSWHAVVVVDQPSAQKE